MAQVISKEKLTVVIPSTNQMRRIKYLEGLLALTIADLVDDRDWRWDADHTCLIVSEKK